MLVKPDEFRNLADAHKQRAFTVAKLNDDYALARTRELLTNAIEKGTTRQEFRKQFNAELGNFGLTRFHLDNVFDTNVLGAYQHGRYRQMTTPALLKRRPYWQYKTVGDSRVRPAHVAMNNRVFAADNPIWDEWYPPNGFRCRCSILTLSKDDAEREGITVEDDPPETTEYEGKTYPVKPDEGWAVSPKDWLKGLESKTRTIPPPAPTKTFQPSRNIKEAKKEAARLGVSFHKNLAGKRPGLKEMNMTREAMELFPSGALQNIRSARYRAKIFTGDRVGECGKLPLAIRNNKGDCAAVGLCDHREKIIYAPSGIKSACGAFGALDRRRTLLHEMSHAFDRVSNNLSQQNKWKEATTKIDWKAIWKKYGSNAHEKRKLEKYANYFIENNGESFAEASARYLFSPATRAELPAEVIEIFDNLFSGLW